MGRLPFIVLYLIPFASILYKYRKRWPVTLRSPRFTIALSFLFSAAFYLSSLPSEINIHSNSSETSLKCATFFGLLYSVVNCILTTCLFRLWSLYTRTQLSAELMKYKEGYQHQKIILQNYGPPLKDCGSNKHRFLAIISTLYCLDVVLPVLTSAVNPTCSRDNPLGLLSDKGLVAISAVANLYAIGRLLITHPHDRFWIRYEFIFTFIGGLCLAASGLKIRTEQMNMVFECVSLFFALFVYVGPFVSCYNAWQKSRQKYELNDTPAFCLTNSLVPRKAIYAAYLKFLYNELSAHELLFWRDVYDFKRSVNKFQKLLNTKPKNFPKLTEKWTELVHQTDHIFQFYLNINAPFQLSMNKKTLEDAITDWSHFRSLIPTFIHESIEISQNRRRKNSTDSTGSDSPIPEKEDSEERRTHDQDLGEFRDIFNVAQTEVEEHLCEESWRRYRDDASSQLAFTAPLESTRSTDGSDDKPNKEEYEKDEKHAQTIEKKRLLDRNEDNQDSHLFSDHKKRTGDIDSPVPLRRKEDVHEGKRDQVVVEMSVREKKTGNVSLGNTLYSKAKKQLQSLERMSEQIAEVKQTALTNVSLAKEKFKAYCGSWLESKELQRSTEVTSDLKNFNRGMGQFLDVYREQDTSQKVDDRIARALDAIGHQV